ncbi:MAG: glycosyltransferase family 2 protein [Desulfobacteraceae bacterium]|jgi:glycosyltransferase involved in cell wall biosynthesis
MTQDESSPVRVAVAIIAQDEEERLPACLASVSFADDVVVVDSGSRDRTVALAESAGARVFVEPWQGFSEQKQLAVDRCAHDWVLILDADERVPEETAVAIRRALASGGASAGAYSFRRRNFLHGRWIRHAGWWPDRIVRLVDRRQGGFDGRTVHERWVTRGEEHVLDAVIDHYSFRDYSEVVDKMERYSSLAARSLFEAGKSAGPFAPGMHGLWMFFRTYLLELGVLDGFEGFVISVMNAGGSFLKYAKLRELAISSGGGIRD